MAGNDKNATVSKEQAVALMEAAKATGRQGEISDALKKAGIAKFADTPAARYEEVKSLIASFGTQEQPAKSKAVRTSLYRPRKGEISNG